MLVNMASSRSEENVNLKYFQHLVVSQCWCVLQFFGLFSCSAVLIILNIIYVISYNYLLSPSSEGNN